MVCMWNAWDPERVTERYLRYARPLVEAEVGFQKLERRDHAAVERLVRTEVPAMEDFAVSSVWSGGVTAHAKDEDLVGTIVVTGMSHGDRAAMMVEAIAVEPAWRGRGIGVVLLGVLPLVLPSQHVEFYYGMCNPREARFYQRAGYTVLEPGMALPFPIGEDPPAFVNTTTTHPCWFYRQA
jgi:GNAT superfamily N-acetyltransferase